MILAVGAWWIKIKQIDNDDWIRRINFVASAAQTNRVTRA